MPDIMIPAADEMQPVQPSMMSIIAGLAANPNVDMDKLERVMEMQERWREAQDKRDALNAFNAAFAAFKADASTIVKNVTITDGPLKGKKHADKFGVCQAIIPAMSKHGLSHSWRLTKDDKDWMEVTCTIRHVKGYSESVSMGAGPDTGPGRNAIQARSSANSYLERITLLAITGMAASDEDNDGNGGDPKAAVEAIVKDILAATNLDELKTMFGAAYRIAAKRPADQQRYREANDQRKAELAQEAK